MTDPNEPQPDADGTAPPEAPPETTHGEPTTPSEPASRFPIRDSAVAAVTAALPVVLQPRFVWLPIVLSLIVNVPTFLVLPGGFTGGAAFGRTMTPAQAQAIFDQFQAQLPLFGAVILVEALLIAPFVSVVLYSLARDYLDGRAPRPMPPDALTLTGRMLGTVLITTLVLAGFVLAGGLIFALLASSGAGAFLLLLMPILIAFAIIVILRLFPVSTLVIQGRGVVDAVQTAWSLTEGHVLQIFRWGAVLWVVSLVAGIALQLLVQVGAELGGAWLGGALAVLVQAPVQLVTAIVITMLTRLLQHGPTAETPARIVGPDWGAPPR